jgi:glycosyltransferase involved in cell wall biosynthesis
MVKLVPKATVVICTYNGAKRIEAVLAALAKQTLDAGEWELLVIDNASTDETQEVATRLIQNLLGGHGRVVREMQPGLSHARARAAQEAAGETICFLDDDNIAEPDFVASAVKAFSERPRAGVIGGKVIAKWEVEPTPLAEAVAPFALAICDLGEEAMMIVGEGGGIVGAGLCIRASILRDIFKVSALTSKVTDRKGSSLISGGDLAISVMARKHAWEIWYVPEMQIQHCLPAGRMEKNYLLRLYEGIGRGQAALRPIYDWKARTSLAWLIGLKDYFRWQLSRSRGPSQKLLREHPAIAADLHDLNQILTLGRARQALSWPR